MIKIMSELIYSICSISHATLGSLAMLSGTVAIVAKKGSRVHRRSGLLFYYSLVLSTCISLLISLSTAHFNLPLALIGIFTLYLLLSGYRCLSFNHNDHNFKIDWLITLVMLLSGIVMVTAPWFLTNGYMIIIGVFGSLSLILSINDIILLQDIKKVKRRYLRIHIGKMTGGYITSISAFLVVNDFFHHYINWFGPGVLGGIFIVYHLRKHKSKRARS